VGIATAAASASRAAEIATAVGCDGAFDVLACLRAAPVGELLDAFGNFELDGTPISIDGGFLPAHPRALFDGGAFSRVPYLLGFNSDEGTLFFIGSTPVTTPAEYTAALAARYGPVAPQVEALYPLSHFATPQDALIRAVGDATLVCPTIDVARRVSGAKNPRTYVYNFARIIPLPFVSVLDLGAFHGAEIPYVFNSVPAPNGFDVQLGSRMQEYWTSFALKGRNPRATKSKSWPRFKERPWRMLRFDAPVITTGITRIKHFRRPECEFWSQVYEAIE
jgi:para-nitrobenzyl esterase